MLEIDCKIKFLEDGTIWIKTGNDCICVHGQQNEQKQTVLEALNTLPTLYARFLQTKVHHRYLQLHSENADLEPGTTVDRSHEECGDCDLRHVNPPGCKGHVQGPSSCKEFQTLRLVEW